MQGADGFAGASPSPAKFKIMVGQHAKAFHRFPKKDLQDVAKTMFKTLGDTQSALNDSINALPDLASLKKEAEAMVAQGKSEAAIVTFFERSGKVKDIVSAINEAQEVLDQLAGACAVTLELADKESGGFNQKD
jgi:hypothetical protein